MKTLSRKLYLQTLFFIYFLFSITICFATITGNQTDDLSPLLPGNLLPFRVEITQAHFQLPVGIHSGIVGVYQGLWIFIAGRTNGLHGFGPTNNFPPDSQNTNIYVVDPNSGLVLSRSLLDPSAGLNQLQIDSLSVTSPQGYQKGHIFYMTGGFGIDTATQTFNTKPILTAIDLPGIVKWVMQPNNKNHSVIKNIRQIYNPIFQIAGGSMFQLGKLTALVFGQNFIGQYTDNSDGIYSEQIRRFRILDDGKHLSVQFESSKPFFPDSNFRRRDLNVIPFVKNYKERTHYGLIAYAGVFTLQTGVWTVPVIINERGIPFMPNPNLPTTFKQAMNQYASAFVGLYSKKHLEMYNILFGGNTYVFFQNGTFQSDSEIPFTNEITTIKMNRFDHFTQYLMDSSYPVILSQQSNPGNQLLFGASAYFIFKEKDLLYRKGIINLDKIKKPTIVGYIVGGIQSTLPNTNTNSDSAASPYVFKVTIIPKQGTCME